MYSSDLIFVIFSPQMYFWDQFILSFVTNIRSFIPPSSLRGAHTRFCWPEREDEGDFRGHPCCCCVSWTGSISEQFSCQVVEFGFSARSLHCLATSLTNSSIPVFETWSTWLWRVKTPAQKLLVLGGTRKTSSYSCCGYWSHPTFLFCTCLTDSLRGPT